MTILLEKERFEQGDDLSMTHIPELSKMAQKVKVLRYEGVYIFGGIEQDSSQEKVNYSL